jgi:hypothetical protein
MRADIAKKEKEKWLRKAEIAKKIAHLKV